MAIEHLPLPSVVSFIQIFSSAIIVIVLKLFGVQVDIFSWEALTGYGLYAVAFVFAIYTNMQALSSSNVETIIVVRACSPIAVTVVECLFMDREVPSPRSILSLLFIAIGACLYCLTDSQFTMRGVNAYSWALAYFFFIVVEMTLGKKITSSVKMRSVWGPVLYQVTLLPSPDIFCLPSLILFFSYLTAVVQNGLAALPMFLIGYTKGDYHEIHTKLLALSSRGMLVIAFSCVAGTLIGYTGWLCRGMVSATSFTLVGVVNKFLTVLLNVMVRARVD